MKNNTLVLLSSLLLISIVGVFACSPKYEDDDILTGKWIESRILIDTLSTQCKKKSYIEFSDYELDIHKRIYSRYEACEGEEEFETEEGTETRTVPPFTEKLGNYSIKGDTLIIKTVENQTDIYIIDKIDFEKMTLETLDRNGNLKYLFYNRFKD